ncbi:MAG: hypothetical protein E7294_13525 [Lachnospiraceae bacterium]|nr:hypothetical protein [Lachnospiraceae bacterium]
MDTMELVVSLVIWIIILSLIKKRKKKGQNVQTLSTGTQMPRPTAQPVRNRQQGSPNAVTKPVPSGQKNAIRQEVQESTTAYLDRKAKQDEIEHRKEALEQRREEQKNYGRINYALRWYEGDPVPDSQKIIKCGYCGAENMVPVRGGRHFNCYFCREEL